ncbi:MAG: VCBS repeat-containing protein, partial [Pirellula sp.]
RELGLLVGVLHSAVADFDGDGDLDIAAVGLFPSAHLESPGAYDSICWWEQRANLEFVRHSIERDQCTHATCEAADVNSDGRVDLIVGQWLAEDRTAFQIFLNLPPEAATSTTTN